MSRDALFPALVVMVALVWLPGCRMMRENQAKADKLAGKVLELLAEGDGETLREQYMSESGRRNTSLEEARRMASLCSRRLGKPKAWSCTSMEMMSNPSGVKGNFSYRVHWEKGEGTLKLTTFTKDDVMKLRSFDVNSDALLQLHETHPDPNAGDDPKEPSATPEA